jgi:NDP-sugar pyrophosphorylase family protein
MIRDSVTAILLAGGFGTRIRALYPDTPKPMIPIGGRPFLEWQLRYLAGQGIRRFVISLGYLAEVAEAYFAARPSDGLAIQTVVEGDPLGTGGATAYAAAATGGDPLLVANADSLAAADLAPAFGLLKRPETDAVILGVRVADASRFGTLAMDQDGRLRGFAEKRPGQGIINAGVYLFRRGVVKQFPARRPLSLETEVFPQLLAAGAVIYAAPAEVPFLDIGTPESLEEAEDFLLRNFT